MVEGNKGRYIDHVTALMLSRWLKHAYSTLPSIHSQRNTIYALSTPPGKGGVAIVRVSGPDALRVWRSMIQSRKDEPEPTPWKLHRCRIVHPEKKTLIDDGLAVYFRGGRKCFLQNAPFERCLFFWLAPHSYTTQNTVEFHIHSGRALISSLLSSLSCLPNLRPAEAGEFTRQALLGGRLDLTQVEGLHDLIEADTEIQRVWALTSALVGSSLVIHSIVGSC